MKYVEAVYNYITRRRQKYLLVFGTPYGQEVLADLAVFCRATESCFDADPRIHAVLEGRREVWNRIQDHLHLTNEQVYALYNHRDSPSE